MPLYFRLSRPVRQQVPRPPGAYKLPQYGCPYQYAVIAKADWLEERYFPHALGFTELNDSPVDEFVLRRDEGMPYQDGKHARPFVTMHELGHHELRRASHPQDEGAIDRTCAYRFRWAHVPF